MDRNDYPLEEIKRLAITPVGFWARALASLVDSILLFVATAPLLFLVYGPDYFVSQKPLHGQVDLFLSYLFPALAIILFWIAKSATPGKMLVSAKIVDAETLEQPSKKQFVGRYFGYFLSALPLMLGFVWIAFDARKQGWHDKLANTLVVRDNG